MAEQEQPRRDILLDFFDMCYKPERFSEYQNLSAIGMALCNTFGDDGFALWQYAARKSPTPDTDDQLALKWRTFEYNTRDDLTIATLYRCAREDNETAYNGIICEHPIDMSDRGIANLIQKYARNRFMWLGDKLYCKTRADYWERDSAILWEYISSELYEILKLITPDLRAIARLGSCARVRAITKMTRVILRAPEELKMDKDPYLIGFTNGVFDLRANTLRNYRNEDYISIITGYAWREPSPEELATMNAIIAQIMPNEEQRALLLEVYASGLFGQCIESFIICCGYGRNGKGLLDDLFIETMGGYAMIGNSAYLTKTRKIEANPDFANVHKKRFILFRHPPKNANLANGSARELIGCGGIPARELCCTVAIECNTRPTFGAMPPDRVIDIDFCAKFVDDTTEVDHARHIYLANTNYKSREFQQKHKFAMFRIAANYFARFAQHGMKLRH